MFEEQRKAFEARKKIYESEILELEIKRKKSQEDCERNILTNNSRIEDILREVNSLEIKKDNLALDISHLNTQRNEASLGLE